MHWDERKFLGINMEFLDVWWNQSYSLFKGTVPQDFVSWFILSKHFELWLWICRDVQMHRSVSRELIRFLHLEKIEVWIAEALKAVQCGAHWGICDVDHATVHISAYLLTYSIPPAAVKLMHARVQACFHASSRGRGGIMLGLIFPVGATGAVESFYPGYK